MTSLRPMLASGRPGAILVVVVCGIFAVAYGLLLFGPGPAGGAKSPA